MTNVRPLRGMHKLKYAKMEKFFQNLNARQIQIVNMDLNVMQIKCALTNALKSHACQLKFAN